MTQKKQKRRSISVRGDIYDRVHAYCQDKDVSMSSFVEDRILNYLDGTEVIPQRTEKNMDTKPTVDIIEDSQPPKIEVEDVLPQPSPTPPPPVRKENFSNMDDSQIRDEIRQHFTF
ncbi:MAG: hypothetical protein JXR95_08845 [Deltaproteobacteria bacterium]|nr:hypothetical protein [Deltaproteobacteria bacterium]